MAPRSFLYATLPARPTPFDRWSTKDVAAMSDVHSSHERTTSPTAASLITTPSEPMKIPHNDQDGTWKSRGRSGRHVVHHEADRSPARSDVSHRSGDIPPAVAALLAMTSIPRPKSTSSLPVRGGKSKARKPIPELDLSSWLEDDLFPAPTGRSPMEVLLSPPEELEEEDLGFGNEVWPNVDTPPRSVSSDSVPSLDTDDSATPSLTTPPTPQFGRRRSSADRRCKVATSPQAEDCAANHPLLFPKVEPEAWESSGPSTPKSDKGTPSFEYSPNTMTKRQRSSLKSNLTASFRAIKSAARSVSNFASPALQPDDFLTRSILTISPHATDDRRPPPLEDTPGPALRRYLNPPIQSASDWNSLPQEFRTRTDYDNCTISIQMQTYRRKKSSKRAVSSAGSEMSVGKLDEELCDPAYMAVPLVRQREPRENSHFLRVIVLEMNMRRVGKLSQDAQGRARIWLPPRKPCSRTASLEEGRIPSRWVGLSADE